MNTQIFWTVRAKNDYREILTYLHFTWSSKELSSFVAKVEQNIFYIASHPDIGNVSKKKSIRRLVISKQTSLYYKVIHGNIYIISLFDNRRNPKKIRFKNH